MRYVLAVAVAAMCLGLFGTTSVSRAEEVKGVKGVLIDQMCAAKMMDKDDPQAAAEEHKKACCEKCAKDGGLAIISGKKMYKLDDASKEKALKYLEKHDNMNVVVSGEEKDGTLSGVKIRENKDKAAKKEG